jgi:hypothetical protein
MESIIENILIQVLGITPSHLTGTFFNDFVNFILLPTVVILIFLNSAADFFTNKKQYKAILSVTFLLVMIAEGFYAPFAMFISNYIVIFLIMSAVFFFGMRIFGTRGKSTIGPKMEDYRKQKMDIRLAEDEIDTLEQEILQRQSEYNKGEINGREMTPDELKVLSKHIHDLRDEKREKENQLRRYKRISHVR